MSVLILSLPSDLHAQAVEKHLSAMSVPARFWSATDLLEKWSFQFNFDRSGFSCNLESSDNKASIDLSGFDSVWYRRPGTVRAVPLPESWMESVTQWESSRALQSIYRMTPALWVNNPEADSEAALKIRQLDLARKAGLTVPETLVTNDPETVRDFFHKTAGRVIYKTIDQETHRFFPRHEVPRGIPTLRLRESDLDHLEQVSSSLHLFQRMIEKVSDIRVTAVGEKIFAVEIKSQEGRGAVDFRLDYSVPMNITELPDQLNENILRLLKSMGLNFGALDFCLDADGQYYFLEVNPAGQFLWMEKRLDIQISRQLARLLAGKETPLVP